MEAYLGQSTRLTRDDMMMTVCRYIYWPHSFTLHEFIRAHSLMQQWIT